MKNIHYFYENVTIYKNVNQIETTGLTVVVSYETRLAMEYKCHCRSDEVNVMGDVLWLKRNLSLNMTVTLWASGSDSRPEQPTVPSLSSSDAA